MRVFSLRWLVTGAITHLHPRLDRLRLEHGLRHADRLPRAAGLCAAACSCRWCSPPSSCCSGPAPNRRIATTLGGMLAVLAPAVGPITGGLITENFSWHWLFLINVVPGLVTVAVALTCLPRETMQFGLLRRLDFVSLLFIALALAGLEIGLKEAPDLGWLSPVVHGPLRRLRAAHAARHPEAAARRRLHPAPRPATWPSAAASASSSASGSLARSISCRCFCPSSATWGRSTSASWFWSPALPSSSRRPSPCCSTAGGRAAADGDRLCACSRSVC